MYVSVNPFLWGFPGRSLHGLADERSCIPSTKWWKIYKVYTFPLQNETVPLIFCLKYKPRQIVHLMYTLNTPAFTSCIVIFWEAQSLPRHFPVDTKLRNEVFSIQIQFHYVEVMLIQHILHVAWSLGGNTQGAKNKVSD